MAELNIEGPVLYPKQYAALFDEARHVFIEASTKAGKTTGALVWQFYQCCDPNRIGEHWWVAPVNVQSKIAFKRAKVLLPREIIKKVINGNDRCIELVNGSIWHFRSASNPDSLYGEDVQSVVIDEASRCKEEAFIAIRSTLTATQGFSRSIGNVKGRKNWFYIESRKAQTSTIASYAYHKLTAWDAVRGGVLAKQEILDAREMLAPHVFKELYLAQPSDDGWNPFGHQNIDDCIVIEGSELLSGEAVCWGIDLAKSVDWTVLVGLNEAGHVAEFYRFQRKGWEVQIPLIKSIVGDTEALVDSTGMGDPILDMLQKDGAINFQGFKFNPGSKQQLMEGLAVDIAQNASHFTEGELAEELRDFEYEHTRTGVRYSAPPGLHDDCVCAFALARLKYRSGTNLAWWS